jgi:hypothetical protein
MFAPAGHDSKLKIVTWLLGRSEEIVPRDGVRVPLRPFPNGIVERADRILHIQQLGDVVVVQ